MAPLSLSRRPWLPVRRLSSEPAKSEFSLLLLKWGQTFPLSHLKGKSKGSKLSSGFQGFPFVSDSHLNQEHCMTAGGVLVEPGGSYSPISTGWQEVLLKISKASDGFLCEAWNQDVSSTVFSDHKVS